MRGSRFVPNGGHRPYRSIPASAGQPRRPAAAALRLTVYPRECGAAREKAGLYQWDEGLSPRVRGSHSATPPLAAKVRSIPASAGQPSFLCDGFDRDRVYPRECGAAKRLRTLVMYMRGLSPRVRGSRPLPRGGASGTRSIPASAGQPA